MLRSLRNESAVGNFGTGPSSSTSSSCKSVFCLPEAKTDPDRFFPESTFAPGALVRSKPLRCGCRKEGAGQRPWFVGDPGKIMFFIVI